MIKIGHLHTVNKVFLSIFRSCTLNISWKFWTFSLVVLHIHKMLESNINTCCSSLGFMTGLQPKTYYSPCTWTNNSFSNRIWRNYKGLKTLAHVCSWDKLWTRCKKKAKPNHHCVCRKEQKQDTMHDPQSLPSSRRWTDHLSHPYKPVPIDLLHPHPI